MRDLVPILHMGAHVMQMPLPVPRRFECRGVGGQSKVSTRWLWPDLL